VRSIDARHARSGATSARGRAADDRGIE
jgi:hypothetical protein